MKTLFSNLVSLTVTSETTLSDVSNSLDDLEKENAHLPKSKKHKAQKSFYFLR